MAAFSAIDAVALLQEHLAMATQQTDVAMGSILSATGSTEVESARNALDFIAGIREQLTEIYGMSEAAVAELRRYMGGF
jgi:hypothetical protein